MYLPDVQATSALSKPNNIAVSSPRCAPAQRLNRGIENALIPRFSFVLWFRGIQPALRPTPNHKRRVEASRCTKHRRSVVPVPELVLRDRVGIDVFTIVKPLVGESALGDGRLASTVGSRDDQ